ncbi:MAG: AAA family ATPase [Chloroflexi bacterium]|nr:AAA family ATPase [Chloroflexota bacterium]
MQYQTTDDLELLLAVLPPYIIDALRKEDKFDRLLEVVLDLGRRPEARYVGREIDLSEHEVTSAELEYLTGRIGDFGDDNRAGIERTLHRISAIRNRKGRVVGLTCRVGRAVYGTLEIMQDIIEEGKSVLLLGRPGVGKTTVLREAARVLGNSKRVVIVDTSNEIGGDGDIPHPAIGRARRMQVATPALQHEVMIEAVENHMPQVIVIDEIGRELEAEAARTIAERGVQLIGTAHGNSLDNLMMNPTLADLIGGIQSVTLSDEEARRRGTQKSILERKAPPTFEVIVEIQDRDHFAVHHDVMKAVDMLLRGRQIPPELRFRDADGQIRIENAPPPAPAPQARAAHADHAERPLPVAHPSPVFEARAPAAALQPVRTLRAYPYGVSQSRMQQAARRLQVPVLTTTELDDADVVLTLKNYYRKRPQRIAEAERRGVPIYVLRANSPLQIESCLAEIFGVERREQASPDDEAEAETRAAINEILAGRRGSVELAPQGPVVRRMQHEMAREANLLSRSHGKDPRRGVRIFHNNG